MSSTGQGSTSGRGRGYQLQPQMHRTNEDPQGGVQDLYPDLTGLFAELTRMTNTVQEGGMRITQPQIDSITAAIDGTTRQLTAFAFRPGQQ